MIICSNLFKDTEIYVMGILYINKIILTIKKDFVQVRFYELMKLNVFRKFSILFITNSVQLCKHLNIIYSCFYSYSKTLRVSLILSNSHLI